ncbi:hypothetical protein QV08_06685 [Gallibacterium salpingitidis]|uniref:HTH Mu-type domain-containing protein n=1 Tax=Gallibacterium salpingitidis TaxID=505341 RepID=A0AB36E1K0_9PAST|nr:helix-turn-helix transcriptional regulator [Gallibacterium salpingitidis]OBX07819.1 hypothetical protein QV08_06685 [Gallibacterium salpingitidis]OBX09722.1 hypothetical protein QV09_07535 [Gallibacterium salpingitidis]
MRNIKEWFSIAELLEKQIKDFPTTDKGISKKADRENWVKRQRAGVKGKTFEYHYSSLPADAQIALGFDKKEMSYTTQKLEAYSTAELDFISTFELIPYFSIKASAGYGAFTEGSAKPTRYLAFTKEWIARKGLHKKDLVMISATGDSMEPSIYNGDVLLVDTSNKDARDGSIYVIRIDDQLWVKRIQGLIGGIRLISDNKAIYSAIDVSFAQNQNVEIIGQVVHVGHDLLV